MRFIEIMTERDIKQTLAHLKALIDHPSTPENERENAKRMYAKISGHEYKKEEPKKTQKPGAKKGPEMSDEEMRRKARAKAAAAEFKKQQRANAEKAKRKPDERKFGKSDMPDFTYYKSDKSPGPTRRKSQYYDFKA